MKSLGADFHRLDAQNMFESRTLDTVIVTVPPNYSIVTYTLRACVIKICKMIHIALLYPSTYLRLPFECAQHLSDFCDIYLLSLFTAAATVVIVRKRTN